ncbi:DUF2510 domain-containing protein [Mycolicibacterium mengxianglii]|uniref:DUF2510 domain-containing protein n=1 Tax=Mycolicibacterium mengxianglii TaxID=2736649 RepID=UPI0038CC1CA1
MTNSLGCGRSPAAPPRAPQSRPSRWAQRPSASGPAWTPPDRATAMTDDLFPRQTPCVCWARPVAAGSSAAAPAATLARMGESRGGPRQPGWYADPSGMAAQRYHNGAGWTVHRRAATNVQTLPPRFAPNSGPEPEPPTVPQPRLTPVAITPDVIKHRRRRRRALDRVLTAVAICSFGAWLGFWVLLALAGILN